MPDRQFPKIGIYITVSEQNAKMINNQADLSKDALLFHNGLGWELIPTWDMFSASGFACIVKGKLTPESSIELTEIDDVNHTYICEAR